VADKSGIQSGDILLSIEGVALAQDGTMANYCDILQSHNLDDALNIEIYRWVNQEVLAGQLNGRALEQKLSLAEPVDEKNTTDATTATQPTISFPSSWKLLFTDDFSNNANGWSTSNEEEDDFAVYQSQLVKGTYRVNADAKQPLDWRQPVPDIVVKDFLLEFDATLAEVSDYAQIIVSFRSTNEANYTLRFDTNNDFFLESLIVQNPESYTIKDWTSSSAFRLQKGSTNRFAILADGTNLTLFANGELLAKLNDETVPNAGDIMLGLSLAEANHSVVIDFDNISLWGDENTMSSAEEVKQPQPVASATPRPKATQPPASQTVGDPPLKVTWSNSMTYEGKDGTTRWCQISMTYQNVSQQSINWPNYQPVFILMNGDGSEAAQYNADYYKAEEGWPNGIKGTPPPLVAGSSADWTWYIFTEQPGQYCEMVYVIVDNWAFQGTYDVKGNLVSADVFPPE